MISVPVLVPHLHQPRTAVFFSLNAAQAMQVRLALIGGGYASIGNVRTKFVLQRNDAHEPALSA